jgi:hypothetical protein
MILVSDQNLVVKTYKGPINFRQFERTEDGQFKLTNPNFKPRIT